MFDTSNNQKVDLIQKAAWRLVRSAQDRFGTNKGSDKRSWCMEELRKLYPKLNHEV